MSPASCRSYVPVYDRAPLRDLLPKKPLAVPRLLARATSSAAGSYSGILCRRPPATKRGTNHFFFCPWKMCNRFFWKFRLWKFPPKGNHMIDSMIWRCFASERARELERDREPEKVRETALVGTIQEQIKTSSSS